MRRRRFLASAAALAGAAGCAGSGDDPGAASTVTPMPVPTASADPTSARANRATGVVEIVSVAVQPGVVVPRTDSIAVVDDAGQYLVLDVTGTAPDRSAVSFRFSGRRYRPEAFGNGLYRDGDWGVTYGEDGGPLVVALPETGDGADAELIWPGGRWAPPPVVVERLEDPLPQFSVSLDGPETAVVGDDPKLTVRVTNDGVGDGRYVLALNREGPRIASAPVTRLTGELDAGERETLTVGAVAPERDRPTRYTLDRPGEGRRQSHEISASGTGET